MNRLHPLGAGQAGGRVETSGKLTLGVGKTAQVDTLSHPMFGQNGRFLPFCTDAA
jgi:hypothetical protein